DYDGIATLCGVRRGFSDPEFVPHMEVCEAMLRASSTDPPKTWDLRGLAILMVGMSNCVQYILPMIGKPMFFEAAIESLRMQCQWEYTVPLGCVFKRNDESALAIWLKAKLQLNTKSERAQYKDRILELWPKATIGQRFTMAHVLG